MRRLLLGTSLLSLSLLMAGEGLAQTRLESRPPEVGGAGAAGSGMVERGVPAYPAAPNLPVPEEVVLQAQEQSEGYFTEMARPGLRGGLVQEAWDDADPDAGIFSYATCDDCSYKIRLREHMVTAVELPAGERIARADLGDNAGFEVQVRGANLLALKPRGYGMDTSLIVYGESGAVYPFYLRAESFNSVNIPDLLVRLEGEIAPAVLEPGMVDGGASGGRAAGAAAPPDASRAAKTLRRKVEGALEGFEPPGGTVSTGDGDFVRNVPFDPSKLHGWGDYDLWGDKGLRPETIYRDDYFTYIKFGARWKDVELPTAYVVVEGIDELVNSRVVGTTFIVESVRPLISLKSGSAYLCIEYTGAVAEPELLATDVNFREAAAPEPTGVLGLLSVSPASLPLPRSLRNRGDQGR